MIALRLDFSLLRKNGWSKEGMISKLTLVAPAKIQFQMLSETEWMYFISDRLQVTGNS